MRVKDALKWAYRRLTSVEQDIILRVRFRLTDEELNAGRRLRVFSRDFLGIELHVGQVAFGAIVLARHKVAPDTAKYLTLMLASGNRAGKTSLLAVLIIYCCLRKLNRQSPASAEEAERWAKLEYHWYHFGISQEVADLVFNDIVRILSGTHEGQQGEGCPWTNDGPVADWTSKEYGDYRWIKFFREVGGAEVHFRTTGERALGSLGKDMHGVSFDEAGIERNLDFLITEVFNLRRLGTGGQLIMVSTPSEDLGSMFADNWTKGDPGNPQRLNTWCSLRMSTRDNVGYGLNADMFERLVEDMDERTTEQNIDGKFLQTKAAYFNGGNVDACFADGLPEVLRVVKGGTYLQGADPAKTQDSMWAVTLKVVPNTEDPLKPFLVGVRADRRAGQKSTETMVGLVVDSFLQYDVPRLKAKCYTAIDATGFGGKMFRESLEQEVPNITNVEFGGTVQKKRKLLGDLRTLIDEGRLILPKVGIWLAVRRQLLGYKLEDRGIEQDAVMALVCAVHLLRRTPAAALDVAKFDLFGMNVLPSEGTLSYEAQIAHQRIAARS